LDFKEKIVFQVVSAIRVQIWSGVDFALVRWSLGWSSDFSSQPDLVFPVVSLVCVLVVTLSRESVSVRPAASCFSFSRPRCRSAAVWICERVLVSGCSSSLGSCAGQAFSLVLADRALGADFLPSGFILEFRQAHARAFLYLLRLPVVS
jgi:hypothetical protein